MDVVNGIDRIAELDAYRIMDTAEEVRYDDITELVSNIFEMPFAVITLLDESRQWFKSKIGLDVSETPREWAFCHHAILQDTILVVPDAHKDDRFKDSPLVTGAPYFRFYAGVPLISPKGVKLGTLCVLDTVARALTAKEISILETLASQVMKHLDTRRDHISLFDSAERQSQAIESLRADLNKMKWLEGLITICSNCSNIRDEEGVWLKLERYIQNNSKADFSHGICPGCRVELYPSLTKRS